MGRVALFSLFFVASLSGWEAAPRCYWEIVDSFYQEPVVTDAFELFDIYESSWQPLYTDIRSNSRKAKERIRRDAKKMNPNPLEHPFDMKKASDLAIDVERELFFEIINRNWRIWDERTIGGMFSHIADQNRKRFAACK